GPADVIHNLTDLPLPFADESVDAVLASHVLEHLERPDLIRLFYDVARILKPGGHFVWIFPYATHSVSYANTLHRQLIDDSTPQLFQIQSYEQENTAGTGAHQGFDFARWEIKEITLTPEAVFRNLSNEELNFAKRHYLNAIEEMQCVMQKESM